MTDRDRADEARTESMRSPYTDPAISPRPSPVEDAAGKAKVLGSTVTGVLNLLVGAGIVTAGVGAGFNAAVVIIVASVPVIVTVGGQLWQAAVIARRAWGEVTPISAPKIVDAATGRLITLVPEDGRSLEQVQGLHR